MPILSHERIKVSAPAGVLGKSGMTYGNNALQSITVGRHTPTDPQSAIGFLGIVDYTSGVVTSDVALDCILVEGSSKADVGGKRNSVHQYAALALAVGTESYVLTSAGLAFAAGSPATVNFGFLTGTLASYLDTQNLPSVVEEGEESRYAVVMGDDGSGIYLDASWQGGSNVLIGTVPFIDSTGALSTQSDYGMPAGVQGLNVNANINRDQILDVRTAGAIQFITTYPIDISCDMELYDLPTASGVNKPGVAGYNANTFKHTLGKLVDIAVRAKAFGKHISPVKNATYASGANGGDPYVKIIGLSMQDETEAVQVGKYLTYNFSFRASDLILPLPQL
jgi:hypothetical protein